MAFKLNTGSIPTRRKISRAVRFAQVKEEPKGRGTRSKTHSPTGLERVKGPSPQAVRTEKSPLETGFSKARSDYLNVRRTQLHREIAQRRNTTLLRAMAPGLQVFGQLLA